MIGHLKLNVVTASGFMIVPFAHIIISDKGGNILYDDYADEDGNTRVYDLEAPDVALTLDRSYTRPAYATYDVETQAHGFIPVIVRNVEIVATATAILKVEMHPAEADINMPNSIAPEMQLNNIFMNNAMPVNMLINNSPQNNMPMNNEWQDNSQDWMFNSAQAIPVQAVPVQEINNPEPEVIVIPPLGLLMPSTQLQFTAPYQSVREVYIPDYITVHLGRPQDTSAKNVRVSFIDYVANVASSEIYPTWPFSSLVANIHCIVTFAINRIYTEWYRSRGFNFDITNSTAYDQYFVYGRNIFENIYQIASDVFNVYARRFGFRNPFFTEYCNGTTSTCRGLSQWGTVDLANRGLNALEILHYYYPDDLELIGTDNIRGIQETYPGSPLRLGSTGAHVQKMQVYLNRIRLNYPLIPQIPNPNGVFDSATDTAVRTFQRAFNLVSDGIIGRTTWNAISFKYVGVIKLAELVSEGERVGIGMRPPNVVLRQGSSGENVVELQFILNNIAAYYAAVPTVIQDGNFGFSTQNAVIQFQKTFNLTQDGVVGPTTWNKLYSVYNGIYENVPVPPNPAPPASNNPPYPSVPLRVGSSGNDVRIMQTYLNTIRTVYPAIVPLLVVDGVFGNNTRTAVINFQRQFLLTPDGIIGPITWNKIVEMFNIVTGRSTG